MIVMDEAVGGFVVEDHPNVGGVVLEAVEGFEDVVGSVLYGAIPAPPVSAAAAGQIGGFFDDLLATGRGFAGAAIERYRSKTAVRYAPGFDRVSRIAPMSLPGRSGTLVPAGVPQSAGLPLVPMLLAGGVVLLLVKLL